MDDKQLEIIRNAGYKKLNDYIEDRYNDELGWGLIMMGTALSPVAAFVGASYIDNPKLSELLGKLGMAITFTDILLSPLMVNHYHVWKEWRTCRQTLKNTKNISEAVSELEKLAKNDSLPNDFFSNIL